VTYRAVIFDLGGVIFPSPFEVFSAYEREHELPDHFLRGVVAKSADSGAWARLERGETELSEFCAGFEAECAAAGGTVDAATLMTAVGTRFEPRAEMLAAVTLIRDKGLKTAALTNNWTEISDDGSGHEMPALHHLFDVIVESAVEGLRKPDPAIYQLTCMRLGVMPQDAVFLDDLGVNLKPARELGMATIKVADPPSALVELETLLGFSLG
jgi:putative hydrolase of the HAD superfamily